MQLRRHIFIVLKLRLDHLGLHRRYHGLILSGHRLLTLVVGTILVPNSTELGCDLANRNHLEVFASAAPFGLALRTLKFLSLSFALMGGLPLFEKSRSNILKSKPCGDKLDLFLVAAKAFADNSAVECKRSKVAHMWIAMLLLLNILHLDKALKILDRQVRQERDLVREKARKVVHTDC